MLNFLLSNFFEANEHYFVLGIAVCAVVILVVCLLIFLNNSKIAKSMLVTKFSVIDLNEKNTTDNSPLYTIIVSNKSMNSISISSIGFEHDGDFFNYRNECKAQLDSKNLDLVILPRGSIKLRLYKEQLEKAVFQTARTKRLKAIKVYIIGLGGENYSVKTKIIGKKMAESYKTYYAFHVLEIMSKFLQSCEKRLSAGVKLNFFQKIRYKCWSKRLKESSAQKPQTAGKNDQSQEEIVDKIDFSLDNNTQICSVDENIEIAITENKSEHLQENLVENNLDQKEIIG